MVGERIARPAAAMPLDDTCRCQHLADTDHALIVARIAEYSGRDLRGRKARSSTDHLRYLVYQHGARVALHRQHRTKLIWIKTLQKKM